MSLGNQPHAAGEAAHTSTPWVWAPNEGNFILHSKSGQIIAEVPCQGANEADGAFIVRACNSHAALVALVEACEAMPFADRPHAALMAARAALNAAKGAQS